MKPFIIAVIPAKMTSQRLPGKNLTDLCGNPLIYYSIRAAQLVEQIDSVYVSSEDDNVLDISVKLGAEPIVRPPELSYPDVTNHDVMKHAVEGIESRSGKCPDIVVLLQPTHPLRKHGDIERGVAMMLDNLQADSLFTLIPNDDLRGQIRNGKFVPEFPLPRNKMIEPKMYTNCGSFYIFRPNRTFMSGRFFGENIIPLVMDKPEFEVDIDTVSDLRLAECLLRTYREEFKHFNVNC
jgi:CMP-N,N'-diacetyllegionaminic acid synthase